MDAVNINAWITISILVFLPILGWYVIRLQSQNMRQEENVGSQLKNHWCKFSIQDFKGNIKIGNFLLRVSSSHDAEKIAKNELKAKYPESYISSISVEVESFPSLEIAYLVKDEAK